MLIPEENVKDLAEIPDNVTSSLEIIPVETVDELLCRALTDIPIPIDWQPPALAETPPPAVEGATFGGIVTH